MSELARASGWPLYVFSRPKTRMIGGITNGSRVMNSTIGRSEGYLSRTQNAVGTMIRMLMMIVRIPAMNE